MIFPSFILLNRPTNRPRFPGTIQDYDPDLARNPRSCFTIPDFQYPQFWHCFRPLWHSFWSLWNCFLCLLCMILAVMPGVWSLTSFIVRYQLLPVSINFLAVFIHCWRFLLSFSFYSAVSILLTTSFQLLSFYLVFSLAVRSFFWVVDSLY